MKKTREKKKEVPRTRSQAATSQTQEAVKAGCTERKKGKKP